MNRIRVLALLSMFLGLAHSFSWDIVLGEKNRLHFYYNGTPKHTEEIPSATAITSVTYDPVHYRVLFAELKNPNVSISSFDLSTRKIQHLLTRASKRYVRIVYDPVTQLLFWKVDRKIYSRSLKHAVSDEALEDNLLVALEEYCIDIAVDGYGRYVYWITDYEMERIQFDGSKREVLIGSKFTDRRNLAIDHQTQKIYWTETIYENYDHQLFIKRADFNGKNRTTLYSITNATYSNTLAVTKDFIYWNSGAQGIIWQLPKNRQHNEEAKIFSLSNRDCLFYHVMAANYTIQEETQGIHNCKTPKNLIQHNTLCVHGTEVSGESRCECAQGYTGERCDVSICHNYCLQGDCSVSAEGQPQCRCKAGFSGERCEVNACHKHCLNNGICSLNKDNEPICQCSAAYDGERCDVSICKGYCLQGNCIIDTVGRPKCSCNSGYSGKRCEVNACHGHCLNSGICSLNEKEEPICHCTSDYEGERCNVTTTNTGAHDDKMTQQILQDLRSEVKQVREDLKCALQFYSDKLDENAVKIQTCEESMKNDFETTMKPHQSQKTSNM